MLRATPAGARTWPNAFGNDRHDGPAPLVGESPHRYFFRVIALDRTLELGLDADSRQVIDDVEDHRLASGTLVGLFEQ